MGGELNGKRAYHRYGSPVITMFVDVDGEVHYLKRCPGCGFDKEVEIGFYTQLHTSDGFCRICKSCERERKRMEYKVNPAYRNKRQRGAKAWRKRMADQKHGVTP